MFTFQAGKEEEKGEKRNPLAESILCKSFSKKSPSDLFPIDQNLISYWPELSHDHPQTAKEAWEMFCHCSLLKFPLMSLLLGEKCEIVSEEFDAINRRTLKDNSLTNRGFKKKKKKVSILYQWAVSKPTVSFGECRVL